MGCIGARGLGSAIIELAAPSNENASERFAGARALSAAEAAAPRARIEPLSEARYKVQLTAGAEIKAKLERACDLMRHRNPSGDLAAVVDAALELLLAKLERERLAKVKTPRPLSRTTRSHAVPAAVRREVFERDGEQCTFSSDDGARCPARGHLELDHIEPRALGGPNSASNLRVRCRAHNRLHAEQLFGKAHVEERVDFRQPLSTWRTTLAGSDHSAGNLACPETTISVHKPFPPSDPIRVPKSTNPVCAISLNENHNASHSSHRNAL